LVADLGVSSVERYAALCLCGESPPSSEWIWFEKLDVAQGDEFIYLF